MALDELAAAVRDKRVSPVELVEESLRRIETLDPAINSVVALRAEEALAEAKASPCTGALAGLPLLVKDLNRVAGMRTTMGSSLHRDAPIDAEDDPVVARMRAEGAIVVGKTNTPAFGHTAVTANSLFGATRNPWNLEKSPGGSSGGSAAALTAGLAPLATTTDGGGSVRIPASLCGLVGYKPTIGAIGRPGAPRWLTFSTSGCTNASVDDVGREAGVVVGPSAGDLCSLPTGSVSLVPEQPTKVFLCRTLRADVDAPVSEALDRMGRTIDDSLAIPVEVIDNPFPIDSMMAWFFVAAAELAESLSAYRDEWESFEPSLRVMVEIGETVTLDDYLRHQRQRYDACRVIDELLGAGVGGRGSESRGSSVLLTPTVNTLAWPADGPMPSRAGSTDDPSITVNTADFNFTGHPGISVPMGIGPDGVPMGCQIIAPRWRDGVAIGLARAIEQACPWPSAAPGYEPFDATFTG